jgi:hypothetical protein
MDDRGGQSERKGRNGRTVRASVIEPDPVTRRRASSTASNFLRLSSKSLRTPSKPRSRLIFQWELEQAAELGWIRIFFRESPPWPRRPHGRAFRANRHRLPPPRGCIEKEISLKHEVFAMRSVFECVPQGMKFYHLRMPPIYVAYLRTYPKANRSCCLGKRITTHAPAGSTSRFG